jgi:hypothetical protein
MLKQPTDGEAFGFTRGDGDFDRLLGVFSPVEPIQSSTDHKRVHHSAVAQPLTRNMSVLRRVTKQAIASIVIAQRQRKRGPVGP